MPLPIGRVAQGIAATPLPTPLERLTKSKYRVEFLRGQLCMIAGSPGAGKTTLALIMAIRSGVRTLYFSADSDEITMAARMASHLTSHPYSSIRQSQAAGLFGEQYGEIVNGSPIRWVFDSEPSLEDIANAITAYVELWGTTPELIIIDNLWNLSTEGGEEFSALRAAVKHCHWLGRKTKSAVWLLHHTSEQNPEWISKAPPRSAIQGKLSQLPEVILTLANDQGVIHLAVVKNRHGMADAHAKEPLSMGMDFGRMRLWDQPEMNINQPQ